MEGEDSEEGTRKFEGRVSAEPAAEPRTSFGLNFFLQEGALLKVLSSSWGTGEREPRERVVKDQRYSRATSPSLMAELTATLSVTCL